MTTNTKKTHRPLDRIMHYVERHGPDDCWPWQGARNGNGVPVAWVDGHVVSARAALWRITNGPSDRHIIMRCGNRRCMNPAHMQPAPPPHPKGQAMLPALTPQEARQLREEAAKGVSIARLGRRYGVSAFTAWRIVHGLRYRSAGGPIRPARGG